MVGTVQGICGTLCHQTPAAHPPSGCPRSPQAPHESLRPSQTPGWASTVLPRGPAWGRGGLLATLVGLEEEMFGARRYPEKHDQRAAFLSLWLSSSLDSATNAGASSAGHTAVPPSRKPPDPLGSTPGGPVPLTPGYAGGGQGGAGRSSQPDPPGATCAEALGSACSPGACGQRLGPLSLFSESSPSVLSGFYGPHMAESHPLVSGSVALSTHGPVLGRGGQSLE